MRKWTTRASELGAQEKQLQSSLPHHRHKILRGKRFLVLKEMLSEMKFPDETLVDDIIRGFDSVGTAGGEGLLPSDFQMATLTVADLEAHAEKSNKAIMHSCKSSGSPIVDEQLWAKTLRGRIQGLVERFGRDAA